MNAKEEAALLSVLRRRGEQIIAVSALSCSVDDYRKAARRVGREHGWRTRTFLVDDGAAVAILWVDREKTALEEEATRRVLSAMFSDNPVHYDDALESVRRENLRVVKRDI
ncbi:hypothetical protein ASG90_16675 [Nocardioides sp. Soil797]|nr:hypothetical protein ASG90_16675 [Nocardioides sp. Soil797]